MNEGIVYKIYPKKIIERIDAKIKLLGENCSFTVSSFLIFRAVMFILIWVLIYFLSDYGYILAPIIAITFYLLLEKILIDNPIKARGKKLEKEALFFFEVLALTLESGRGLKQALSLTTLNIDSEISKEFKRTLNEIDMGKSLTESLEAMKKRIPSEIINNAILNMIQASNYGNDICSQIYNQIDFLREKQILGVKAEISKLPTKISIISVLFFVPIMLLIILAPVLIEYIMR